MWLFWWFSFTSRYLFRSTPHTLLTLFHALQTILSLTISLLPDVTASKRGCIRTRIKRLGVRVRSSMPTRRSGRSAVMRMRVNYGSFCRWLKVVVVSLFISTLPNVTSSQGSCIWTRINCLRVGVGRSMRTLVRDRMVSVNRNHRCYFRRYWKMGFSALAVEVSAIAILPCNWSWHDDVARWGTKRPPCLAALGGWCAVALKLRGSGGQLAGKLEGGGVGDGKDGACCGEIGELHVFGWDLCKVDSGCWLCMGLPWCSCVVLWCVWYLRLCSWICCPERTCRSSTYRFLWESMLFQSF